MTTMIKSFKSCAKYSSIYLPCLTYSTAKESVNLAFNVYDNVSKTNQGLPVVIMHGLFGSKFNWNSLGKSINAKTVPNRKIITVDARNHGDSPHTDEHTYESMAEDVVLLLNNLKLNRVALIGHSMGGRTMMCLALKYPHLVEKAIIVDISPVSGIGTNNTNISLFLHSMKSIRLSPSETIHNARKIADEQLQKIINEKSLRDFLITNLVKNEDGSFKWRINLDTLERDVDNIGQFPHISGSHFDGPTLFIAGGKSDYVKKSDLPEIKRLFPNSQLVFIPNAGHWVHSEKSAEFLDLVFKFLNEK